MLLGTDRRQMQFDQMFAGSAAASVVVGIIGVVIVGLAGLTIDGPTGQALLALAPCLPLVLLQDAYRYRSLARRHPIDAVVNDGVWLIGALVGLFILRRTDTDSLPLAIVAANATAALGLMIVVQRSHARPRLDQLAVWLRTCTPVAIRLTGDFLVALAYGVIPLVLFTAWNANLDQAGSLRSAQVLMGPLAVLFAGSTTYMQPIMILRHRQGGSVVRLAAKQSIGNAALTVIWVGGVALIPDQIGVRIFGESWRGATEIAIVMGVSFVGLAILTGPLTAMRSRGQLTANLVTQCVIATLVAITAGFGGLLINEGTLRGFAAGNVLGSAIAWVLFIRWPIRDMLAERI